MRGKSCDFKILSFFLKKKMPSCKELRQELVNCMLKSDCVLIKRHTVKGEISFIIEYSAEIICSGSKFGSIFINSIFPPECLQPEHANDVPKECQSIRKSFFECRRGLVY